MHPKIFKTIEEILARNNVSGKVLEIGAMPNKASLLSSDVLSDCERIGINLHDVGEHGGFKVVQGNSNDMSMFEDESFDCVLSNAVLEHDKYFWKSIAEMKRVLKKGGLMVIGTPTYGEKSPLLMKIGKRIKKYHRSYLSEALAFATFTFCVHAAPSDYYRYSESTFKEVFFEGFRDVNIKTMLTPPRTIGYGFKE